MSIAKVFSIGQLSAESLLNAVIPLVDATFVGSIAHTRAHSVKGPTYLELAALA